MPRVVRLRKNGADLGLLVLLVAILCAGLSKSHPGPEPKAVGQRTQAQTGGWGGSDPKYLIFWGTPTDVLDIAARVGTTGDGKTRQLGLGLALKTFDDEKDLPARIHEAFQVAKKNNLAVALSFDSHNFWSSRPDLWNWFDPQKPGYNPANKSNVEWYDWKGTPNKTRYLDWGSAERLAPHMCYTSPAVRREITRIVTSVIGPAVNSELELLKKEGKEYLFAGILVGSEITIDDYTHPDDPAIAKLMEQDGAPRGRLGYCALTQHGYSENNPPPDFRQALAEVNQEFIAFWAKQFVDAGISPSRLYTHIAAPFVQETTNGPIWNAFNDYSRPGWTTYPVRFLNADFQVLYEELKKHGNPPWGGVEANAGIPIAMGAPPVAWEEYLARHFNHGAKLVGINFGASSELLVKLLRDSAFSPEALAAYKKFLTGEPLQATAARPAPEQGAEQPFARIQRKMKQVQESVQRLQEAGRDASSVQQIMRDFPPLMQEGKLKEAEAVLDRALEVLHQIPPPSYE